MLVVFSLAATVAIFALTRGSTPPPHPLALPSEIVGPDPLAFDARHTAAYERAAAFGLSHALFVNSPGGVLATARRTAAFRPLVDKAVSGSGIDPDLVEAIIFLESGGRPEVIAGSDPVNAAGLTQILAGTATDFLGLHVELSASRRLTQEIGRALQQGDEQAVVRLQNERRSVDARFDPAQALAGTVRYLTAARDEFGQDDLAVASYHMGIGNLDGVVRAYTGEAGGSISDIVRKHDISYARLYFDSSPASHREAWARLASFGDDSQTYYWRVLAARDIMRLYRQDPQRLERLAKLHGHLPSAELVLQPPSSTRRFPTPAALESALRRGVLQALPDEPNRFHYRVDRRLAQLVSALGAPSAAYGSLRPRARRLLDYLAAQVFVLSREPRPLIVTRATYDEESGELLTPQHLASRNEHSSVHATGYSFDVRRRYGSGAQAEAFQWTLERLQALGLIVWIRGENVIHVVVSPRSDARVPAQRS